MILWLLVDRKKEISQNLNAFLHRYKVIPSKLLILEYSQRSSYWTPLGKGFLPAN